VNWGLGDFDGNVEMNISTNEVSSSILGATQLLTDAAPESLYIKKETIIIRKIDSIISDFIDTHNEVIFMKMDVQGYESKVLAGASQTLKHINGIQLEVSLVELYSGETLFEEMLSFMKCSGFVLYSLLPGLYDRATGRLLQTDCIFIRA
jgi:hypothetical protein